MLLNILKKSLRMGKATVKTTSDLVMWLHELGSRAVKPVEDVDTDVEESDELDALPEGWNDFGLLPTFGITSLAMRELMADVPLEVRDEVRKMLGLRPNWDELKSRYVFIPEDATNEEAAVLLHSVNVRCCPVCDGLDPDCGLQLELDRLWLSNPHPVQEDCIFLNPITWVGIVEPSEVA